MSLLKDDSSVSCVCSKTLSDGGCRRYANIIDCLKQILPDVVARPKDRNLWDSLLVCELSCNRFAFVRTQLRSIQRSLKRLQRSEETDPIIIYENNYVPNSINVLNKIKEFIPKTKFTSKNNVIQLSNDYDKQSLISLLNNIVSSLQSDIKVHNNKTTTHHT
ncbi:BRO-B [Rachiplusia nu nucleopolyhedrovirus]|uniref:BRO-B n=1 Tax=Rachiplusia nu nucleopolyhedrovirus TaxID=2605775 RepID=A0AAE6IRD6_9ABAC|nr:BRO-B [Rachiplusia nu nucleopolyhedrovirus]QEI03664.1 BRO-B [Rachiplusia nu nucleopolyhedrovirus]